MLEQLTYFILLLIERAGYAGLFFLTFFSSLNIPVPSEIVVPFAGFLASLGTFNLAVVIALAFTGNCAGALLSYEIGRRGGREFVQKYGKWFFVSPHDLRLADRLFLKFGRWVVFFGLMTPVIRSFIAFLAGVTRMPRKNFILSVFFSALLWNFALGYFGFVMGQNWHALGKYFQDLDVIIISVLAAAVTWWVVRHLRFLGKEGN